MKKKQLALWFMDVISLILETKLYLVWLVLDLLKICIFMRIFKCSKMYIWCEDMLANCTKHKFAIIFKIMVCKLCVKVLITM